MISWDKHPDCSVRGHAETASYASSFLFKDRPDNSKLVLGIGPVTGMVKVRLNGNEAGAAWTASWKVDISLTIKTAENKIEIEAANTLVNHLINESSLKKR